MTSIGGTGSITAPASSRPSQPQSSGPTADAARDAKSGPRIEGALRVVVLVVAVAFFLTFVAIALLRVRYPFELEWMEGGTYDAVRRAMTGSSLYGRPSLSYVAYLYTPLYDYVAGAATAVLGSTIATLRAVSIASSMVAAAAIYALIRHETKDHWASAIGAGLFFACYRISGAWFDVARVDSLFIALLFGGVFLVRRARTSTSVTAGSAVLGAAFLTKQQALPVAAALGVWLFVAERARVRSFLLGFGAVVLGGSIALELTSGGWYHTYAFELMLRHDIVPHEITAFWLDDILVPVGIATAIAVAALASLWKSDRRTAWFYVAVAVGCFVAAYSARLHSGGYGNVLLPAYGMLAVLFGIGVHFVGRSSISGSRRIAVVVLCAACVQFGLLVYDPSAQVPSNADVAAGHRMVAELATLPGPVYLPGHGWYLEKAGRPTSAQSAAIADILRARIDPTSRRLSEQLERAIREQRFGSIVVDSNPALSYVPRDLRRYYRVARRLDAPWPLTGTSTKPLTIWVRRASA